jgi:hypothetical protein
MKDIHCSAFAAATRECPVVKYIDLTGNRITDAGMEAITSLLRWQVMLSCGPLGCGGHQSKKLQPPAGMSVPAYTKELSSALPVIIPEDVFTDDVRRHHTTFVPRWLMETGVELVPTTLQESADVAKGVRDRLARADVKHPSIIRATSSRRTATGEEISESTLGDEDAPHFQVSTARHSFICCANTICGKMDRASALHPAGVSGFFTYSKSSFGDAMLCSFCGSSWIQPVLLLEGIKTYDVMHAGRAISLAKYNMQTDVRRAAAVNMLQALHARNGITVEQLAGFSAERVSGHIRVFREKLRMGAFRYFVIPTAENKRLFEARMTADLEVYGPGVSKLVFNDYTTFCDGLSAHSAIAVCGWLRNFAQNEFAASSIPDMLSSFSDRLHAEYEGCAAALLEELAQRGWQLQDSSVEKSAAYIESYHSRLQDYFVDALEHIRMLDMSAYPAASWLALSSHAGEVAVMGTVPICGDTTTTKDGKYCAASDITTLWWRTAAYDDTACPLSMVFAPPEGEGRHQVAVSLNDITRLLDTLQLTTMIRMRNDIQDEEATLPVVVFGSERPDDFNYNAGEAAREDEWNGFMVAESRILTGDPSFNSIKRWSDSMSLHTAYKDAWAATAAYMSVAPPPVLPSLSKGQWSIPCEADWYMDTAARSICAVIVVKKDLLARLPQLPSTDVLWWYEGGGTAEQFAAVTKQIEPKYTYTPTERQPRRRKRWYNTICKAWVATRIRHELTSLPGVVHSHPGIAA